MTVKFIPLALIEDPDDRFYCWGCGDWNATICIVGDDDMWHGYACCDSEAHAAQAVQAHNDMMAAVPNDASLFWDDPISCWGVKA